MSLQSEGRPRPNWLILVAALPTLAFVGGALSGIAVAVIRSLHRSLILGVGSPLDLMREEAFFLVAGGALFGGIIGLPIIVIMWVIGHAFTKRRPIDGLVLGAVAGCPAAIFFLALLRSDAALFGLATVPIGALLGHFMCHVGYRDPT